MRGLHFGLWRFGSKGRFWHPSIRILAHSWGIARTTRQGRELALSTEGRGRIRPTGELVRPSSEVKTVPTSFLVVSLAAFVFAFVGSLPLAGPIALLVISNGASGRYKEALRIALGAATAEGIYASLAFWGFATFLARYALVLPISHGVTAVVLCGLGVRFLFFKVKEDAKHAKEPKPGRFWVGFSVAALNPTLLATWGAITTFLYARQLVQFTGLLAIPFRRLYASGRDRRVGADDRGAPEALPEPRPPQRRSRADRSFDGSPPDRCWCVVRGSELGPLRPPTRARAPAPPKRRGARSGPDPWAPGSAPVVGPRLRGPWIAGTRVEAPCPITTPSATPLSGDPELPARSSSSPTAPETRRGRRIALGVVLVITFLAAAWIASPLWVGLMLGTVMAFTAQPLYRKLLRRQAQPQTGDT